MTRNVLAKTMLAGQALLEHLKDATAQALGILQQACPTDLPSTPPGRLAAMRVRIDAMLQAVRTIRPALDKFYASLSDEQKERFNSLDTSRQPERSRSTDLARLCGGHSVTGGLPINKMASRLHLNSSQNAALNDLDRALQPSSPPASVAPAAPLAMAAADIATPPASSLAVSKGGSAWDQTSLIGKIFIGFGALLTMASAARMFMT